MKLALRVALVIAFAHSIALADKGVERDEVPAAEAERFMTFFNKFVDAVVQNKDNCDKMASSITEVINANAEVVKRANEAKAAKKKLPKVYEDKMMARVKEMIGPMQKCGSNKDVKAAVGRLDPKNEKK